ncbi:MAG: response regulator [Proteobacteria bacterium]|nr:response regulator [Pseudomonadota bacterium]
MKILVADDDPDLLDLVAYALGQAGYLVVKAGDGNAALSRFDSEAPDLVILDINMPGQSGFDVCAAIRGRSSAPVMMLTARGEEQDLVRALDLGADDYPHQAVQPAHAAGEGQGAAAPRATGTQRRPRHGWPHHARCR